MNKYFYHLTSFDNTQKILEKRVLTYGKGEERGGYNEKQISFADFLSRYLEDFGDICFEFKAKSLLAKNEIYPFDYGMEEKYFYLPDGFPAMPFWECEWQTKKAKFGYDDINKIILFSDKLSTKKIGILVNFFKKSKIKYEITEFIKLPEPDYGFFIKRYLKRATNKTIKKNLNSFLNLLNKYEYKTKT